MSESTITAPAEDASGFRQRRVEVAPGQPLIVYANNTKLRASLFDVMLDFGVVVNMDDESIAIQDAVTVMMSPQHAKVFLRILDKHIRDYEAKFGRLPEAPQPEEDKS